MKPGDIIAERFEIERLAGSGGMGAVYRARDRLTGDLAALKVLWGHHLEHPEQGERFEREARILYELHHPGIVRYIAHGATDEGEPYLALEWLDGESLAQRLRRGGLSVGESVALARRIADALGAAHQRGIVHRDIKPSNLYLEGGSLDRSKLLDFGIAKVAGGTPLTVTGMVMGTPFYMAPEQARGERHIDTRADVFALGCVLFHCVTGQAPFRAEELHTALLKVVLDEAPRLAEMREGVPPALDALVARMLSKKPAARPADAAAVIQELDALGLVGEPVPEPPERALNTPTRESDRGRPISITGRELRAVCAVMTRLDPAVDEARIAPTQTMTLAATLPMWQRAPEPASPFASGEEVLSPPPAPDRRATLLAVASRHQARFETMADGVVLAVFGGAGAATDQAAQAARCALAMRAVLPEAPMALVAGRGASAAGLPVDEVIERGRALLVREAAFPEAIRLDLVVAGLLGGRFDVGGDARGLVLRGERDMGEVARTVLGRPTPCVGRDHELTILDSVLEECITEPTSRAVLVTASAGVGKSRLAQEFIRRVEARGDHGAELCPVQIWVAHGDPMSAGSPFGLLSQMLRREAGLREGEPRAVRQQKLRARVARHVPESDVTRVAQFLGELTAVGFEDRESVELRAARQDPMLMGDQMRRAWEDLLIAECSGHALILVLEDLHWGDIPTVKFIDATLRSLHDRPLFVLALGRPEVHDLFPRMWAPRGVQEIRLRELGRRGSEKLVREVLGGDIDDAVLARIVERAAGNAFYLEELIRAAADGKSEDLPETVLAMVEARLGSLSAEARRVLRAASFFGQVFARGALGPLLGGDHPSLGASLSDLVERELVVRRGEGRFPGQEEYAFRHSLVREAAYAMLTEADRTLGHRLAAHWLEQAGERDAKVLAEHLERGGEPEKAVSKYRRAAEQALEGNDFEAAIALAERGAKSASGETLGALYLQKAEANKWRGSAAEAEQCAASAMARFPLGSALWYVAAAEVGSMRLRLGRHEELARLAEEVQAQGLAFVLSSSEPPSASLSGPSSPAARLSSLPPPGSTTGAAVSAVARLAGSLLHDGQHALAEALIRSIDRVAGPIAEVDYGVAARLYALHASRALCYGDPASFLRYTELSIPSFALTGDRRNACLGQVNAAHAVLQLGDYPQAERVLRAARADADRMGLHNVSAFARQNLGPALAHQGALQEAREVELDAVRTFAAQENRRQEGRGRVYLAQILVLSGDLEGALVEARAGALRLTPIPPLRAFALGVLVRVLLLRGGAEEALAVAREGMELLLSLAGMEEGESILRLAYAEALAAAGNRPAAEDALGVARRRLLERAGRITDPIWRRSFCERVPENARTLSLAREWMNAPIA
jgi:eukaryotic-like serine/threonine-protein kinase